MPNQNYFVCPRCGSVHDVDPKPMEYFSSSAGAERTDPEQIRRRWETPALRVVEAIHRDYAPDLDDNDGGQILVWILDLVEQVASQPSERPAPSGWQPGWEIRGQRAELNPIALLQFCRRTVLGHENYARIEAYVLSVTGISRLKAARLAAPPGVDDPVSRGPQEKNKES